jgi:glucosamine--fructose-6-phosphate aminotransferase (isomerizing)
MCGIVGYVGHADDQNAVSIILDGLQRLEYRGYDSAGIAVLDPDQRLEIRRDVGKLSNLCQRVAAQPLSGHIGIGHTRWATHGVPAERNAHPHLSMSGDFVLVHNGIVENFLELREELMAEGFTFNSETDTEVIVQLIERYAHNGARGDLVEATRCAARRLRGAHAIVVMSKTMPDCMVVVRIGNAGGVVIGVGQNAHFVASDIPAILDHTRDLVFLEDRQIGVVTVTGFTLETLDGQAVAAVVQRVPYDPISAAKGTYRHFMQKEIFEQPRSITDTLAGRIDFQNGKVVLPDLNLTEARAKSLRRLVIVGCGTSYYSGLIGKFLIERLARLHVEVDYGSEYRYRDPLLDADTAVLAITQSGETVDTLAAMEAAREQGALVWSIVNAIGSQAMRLADGYLSMNAGPEIGVASTKAFTASVVDQYLLAVYLGQLRGTLSGVDRQCCLQDVVRLPEIIAQVLQQAEQIDALAMRLVNYRGFLYLGRGINYPVALEGALKLKEISYLHAEGYPAGEMKHGPIALIDAEMPVLAVALRDALYEKMISQIEQAKARGGIVIALATEGDEVIATKADHIIYIPPVPELLSPVVAVVPLQLLAYFIAVHRGADVDQPRNLAKSVTVE